MASIGSLVVEMSANVTSLKTDLDKGRREFQRFAKDASKSVAGIEAGFRGLKMAAGALGVGLGIGGLIRLGNELLAAAGGLKDLSTQMGVSIQFLQTLQDVATTAGVSFDTLGTAMQALRKAEGLAVGGSKEIIDALNTMGVKILDVNRNTRSSEAVLKDIADAYVAAADKAKFLAEASKVTGRSTQELVPILEGGAAGLEATATGIHHISDAQAVAAQKMQDEWDAMMLNAKRWASTILVEVLNPTAERQAEAQRVAAEGQDKLIADLESGIERIAKDHESLWTRLKSGWTDYVSFIGNLQIVPSAPTLAPGAPRPGSLYSLYPGITNTSGPPTGYQKGGANVGGIAGMIGAPEPVPVRYIGSPPNETALGGAILAMPPSLTRPEPPGASNPLFVSPGGGGKTAADVIKDLRFEIDQLNRSPVAQDVFKALKAGGGIDLASQAGQTIESLVTTIDRLKLAQDAANESFARGADLAAREDEARKAAGERAQELIATREGLVADYGRELQQGQALVSALQEGQQAYAVEAKYQEIANRFRQAGLPLYGAEIDKARDLAGALVDLDRIREVTDAMREFANTMQTDVVGAITGVVAGTEDLDQALNQILQDVARGLLDVLNKSSATGSIGESLFESLIGSIPSMWAGAGAAAGGGLGADVGAMIAGSPALFAAGGRPPLGRASIVGEQGPELFVPDAAGTVVPNGILDQLGGAGRTINIDARGATRDMVPALMQQLNALQADHTRLRRDVGPLAVAAVGNERRRSTGYAKTFAGKGSVR